MSIYFIKRLFVFIPSLLLVSLFVFALSMAVPGDAAERILLEREGMEADEDAYARIAKQLGIDKPVFYFSLSSIAYP
ncbi:MAG TPA: ABC transporter permease, partial [Phaeodactylibacter sp.]|nr:ABC transporter permease [Phaeodactylibacter sp.]